jgi:arsenate reductase-like glutaredoxin family protein
MGNKYEKAKKLSEEKFKRIIGVKKKTFAEMVNILQTAYAEKNKRGGRNPKLDIEEMLLLALEYWRQYVTFAELGFNYDVAESTAHDITVWVEDVLIKSGLFALPGKKALLENEEIEIVLVDVMERPIERPKKNKNNTIPAKEKSTP